MRPCRVQSSRATTARHTSTGSRPRWWPGWSGWQPGRAGAAARRRYGLVGRWPGCRLDLARARSLLVGRLAASALGLVAARRAWVLRCTDDGYRRPPGPWRGASARPRWSAVEDAVTTHRHDVRLRASCGSPTGGPRRSRWACWPLDREDVRARAPAAARSAATRLRPPADVLSRGWPARRGLIRRSADRCLVTCARCREASPSPVYGARLLSGLRVQPSRGFKSRRLRQRVEAVAVGSHPPGGAAAFLAGLDNRRFCGQAAPLWCCLARGSGHSPHRARPAVGRTALSVVAGRRCRPADEPASNQPHRPQKATVPKCGHAPTPRGQAPSNCIFLQCNFVRQRRAHALPDPARQTTGGGPFRGPSQLTKVGKL